MYLYFEIDINGEKVEFTSSVVGTSKSGKYVIYTLARTLAFLSDRPIVALTIEESIKGIFLNYEDQLAGFDKSCPVLRLEKVSLA